MEYERTSMAQFDEIERLIKAGISNRQIAKALKCRKTLVADIRSGEVRRDVISATKKPENRLPPGWALQLDWEAIEKDIRDGHQFKQIWDEVAKERTSYPNFYKYVNVRFSSLLSATVTLREFKPGEHCEVDYAGDKIEWLDTRTGEINEAHVFLGILCFSQKIFAYAARDEKKPNWLDSHRRMFEFYNGVSAILVPDCLKNGVVKCHRYDPDLNLDYVELAAHYNTAVVPARSRRPKDKAFIENAVGIVMRYFRFIYRRRTFTSLTEINEALRVVIDQINNKVHTRFKVSRQERFDSLEKVALRPLPIEPYVLASWKPKALLHPDCTVAASDGNFYSAPHIYRGKELRVKTGPSFIEIFLDLERIAIHDRAIGKVGERITKNEHLPPNSRAYKEATPQMILSKARFANVDLHKLIDELFQEDALAHLRRAQGFVRKAYATIQTHGREKATPWIACAIAQMRRFGRIRVKAFEEMIQVEIKKSAILREDRTIVRQPGNPMVRGHGTPKPEGIDQQVPAQLKLI
jgi:transposase